MIQQPMRGEASTSQYRAVVTPAADINTGPYQRVSQVAVAQYVQEVNAGVMAVQHGQNYIRAHPGELTAAASALSSSHSCTGAPLNSVPLLGRLQADIDGGMSVPRYDNSVRLGGVPVHHLVNTPFIADTQTSMPTVTSNQLSLLPVAKAQVTTAASEQADPASGPGSAPSSAGTDQRPAQGAGSNEPEVNGDRAQQARLNMSRYKESCRENVSDIKYLAKSIQGFQPFPRYVAQACQKQRQIFVHAQMQSMPCQPLEKTAQTSLGALKIKPAFDVSQASLMAAQSFGTLAGVPYAADRLDIETMSLQRAIVELDKERKEETNKINQHLSNLYEVLRRFKKRLEVCETRHPQEGMERTASNANVFDGGTCLHEDNKTNTGLVAQTIQRRDAEVQTTEEDIHQAVGKQTVAEVTSLESEIDVDQERFKKLETEVATLRTVVNEVLLINRTFSIQLKELRLAQKSAKVLRTIDTNTTQPTIEGITEDPSSPSRNGSKALDLSPETAQRTPSSRRKRQDTPSSTVSESQSDPITSSQRQNGISTPNIGPSTSGAGRRSVESHSASGGSSSRPNLKKSRPLPPSSPLSHSSSSSKGDGASAFSSSSSVKKARHTQISDKRKQFSKNRSSKVSRPPPHQIYDISDSTDEDSPIASSDDEDEDGEQASSSNVDAARPDKRAGLNKRPQFDDPPSTSTTPRLKRTRPDCVPRCM